MGFDDEMKRAKGSAVVPASHYARVINGIYERVMGKLASESTNPLKYGPLPIKSSNLAQGGDYIPGTKHMCTYGEYDAMGCYYLDVGGTPIEFEIKVMRTAAGNDLIDFMGILYKPGDDEDEFVEKVKEQFIKKAARLAK
ncbi:hypothetical protein WME94_26400 [Sorangium sp. So ce429]